MTPIVYSTDIHTLQPQSPNSIYKQHGIHHESLKSLDTIGLIEYQELVEGLTAETYRDFEIFYYKKPLQITKGQTINLGNISFTDIGKELAPMSGSHPVNGFYEFVSKRIFQQKKLKE